jgi:hypothetical protein
MKDLTIKQIIKGAKELTTDNLHGQARELFASMAGHKNETLLRKLNLVQDEVGHTTETMSKTRERLFAQVMDSLEIQFPDYIEAIKKAL